MRGVVKLGRCVWILVAVVGLVAGAALVVAASVAWQRRRAMVTAARVRVKGVRASE